MPLLDVRDLTVRFPGGYAVDGVSFELRQGETLGIVGESGSGKSMLCRAIVRLTPPTGVVAGSVRFDGVDLSGLPPRRMRALRGARLAMVLQNPMTALNPVVRVGRQLTETLRQHRELDRRTARARAADLLRRVGIPEPDRRLRCYPHELSGGMRQRVCIAIALAGGPDLLLADEPTTALDAMVQRQILDLLGALRQAEGMAMVLVSHDLGVVAGRTDRVLVMYGGRIVESGPTGEVFRSPRHPYTAAMLASIPRLGQPSGTSLAEIPGRPVDLRDAPSGCRFAPRCRYARPRCDQDDPAAGAASQPAPVVDRAAACFYPLDPADA